MTPLETFQAVEKLILAKSSAYLTNSQLEIVSITRNTKQKSTTLEIIIDTIGDQPMSLAVVVNAYNQFNDYVTHYIEQTQINPEDVPALEVLSAGIERPITDIIGLAKAVSKFIYVELRSPVNNQNQVEGTLIEFNTQTQDLVLQYRQKTRLIKLTTNYQNIKFVRYAAKI